jgi:hypothetical protein
MVNALYCSRYKGIARRSACQEMAIVFLNVNIVIVNMRPGFYRRYCRSGPSKRAFSSGFLPRHCKERSDEAIQYVIARSRRRRGTRRCGARAERKLALVMPSREEEPTPSRAQSCSNELPRREGGSQRQNKRSAVNLTPKVSPRGGFAAVGSYSFFQR